MAGVPAAARVVHRVRLAGPAHCRLEIGDGVAPGDRLRRELERLSGDMPLALGVTGSASHSRADAWIDGTSMPQVDEVRSLLDTGGGRPAGADVDPPDEPAIRSRYRAESRAIVRATAKPGDGIISRWVNRPVSQAISSLLLRIPGIRPIHATLGTALLALAMFAALLLGTRYGQVWGALLFQSASIFDGVDGEIARATFHTSRGGAMLDSLVDAATNLGFILGLTINLALLGAARPAAAGVFGLLLLAGGLALIGRASARSGEPFSFDVVKHHYRNRAGGAPSGWMRAATFVTSRDFFALAFAVAILCDLAGPMLELFAVAALLWFVAVLRALTAVRL